LTYYYIKVISEPRSPHASRLRQRKFERLRGLRIPPDGLPGSLSTTYTRCGKPACRCAEGEGHPVWRLTFMAGGKKRVERVPAEWVEEVRQRVEAGRRFKDAVAEVFALNAQLLALGRRQRRR
jgi:hypothetical protein